MPNAEERFKLGARDLIPRPRVRGYPISGAQFAASHHSVSRRNFYSPTLQLVVQRYRLLCRGIDENASWSVTSPLRVGKICKHLIKMRRTHLLSVPEVREDALIEFRVNNDSFFVRSENWRIWFHFGQVACVHFIQKRCRTPNECLPASHS